ncbi:MAG: hypothetical protein GXY05_05860 [Clostridiales bacterium]|nr:hypothetical protein [Clostridiales bacterium]
MKKNKRKLRLVIIGVSVFVLSAAIAAAFTYSYLKYEIPKQAGVLAGEAFSIITAQEGGWTRLTADIVLEGNALHIEGCMNYSAGKAELTASGSYIGDEPAALSLDGDKLYIKTADAIRLFGNDGPLNHVIDLEFIRTSDLPEYYVSVNLPAHVLPSLKSRPYWASNLDMSFNTLLRDINETVKIEGVVKKDGVYKVSLDTDQLLALSGSAAEAVSRNSEQHYINIYGSMLSYMSNILNTSLPYRTALEKPVSDRYIELPGTIPEGGQRIREIILESAESLKAFITEKQAYLSYFIQKDGNSFIQNLRIEFSEGSVDITLATGQQQTTMTPPDARPVEEFFVFANPQSTAEPPDDVLIVG